jgi:DNA segregation ATPase FtsK/SpoIIIE-like protein
MANNIVSRKYNRAMTLRLVSRWSGRKLLTGDSVEHAGASVDLVGTDQVQTGMDASQSGSAYEVQSDTGAYADNPDIWRRRFVKRGMSRLRRSIRRFGGWLVIARAFLKELRNPKLSGDERRIMLTRLRRWDEAELDEYRRAKVADALFRFHKEQARLIGVRIIEVLTNLGFCFKVNKNERVFVKKRIKISQCDVSPYAYTYHLTRMPFGVRMTEIAQDVVSTELSASIGKKVRYDLDMEGLRFSVEIGSTLSIPNFVKFGDLFDKFPMPKNLPPLAFWAGLSANGAPVYRNLAAAPHMIIAGQSGGGKSNAANAIACQLITRNDPAIMRMVFFDLKGGVEFSHFAGIPHLWPMKDGHWESDGILEYPTDVMPALDVLFKECMHRLGKLKAAGKKDINEFNRGKHPKNRLPYIVVLFDEWASTKKMVGDKAEVALSNIANLSRAAGMHFILCTQYPKAEILSTIISVNFPWRLAFNMPSGASQSVLGSWDAVGLTIPGRAILQTSEGPMQVQTPRITNNNVTMIANGAKSGMLNISAMMSVDADDILKWALNNTGGKLERDTLFNQFREKIPKDALDDLLRSMDNQTFDVQGTLYKIMPPSGSRSRRMEITEDQGPSADSSGDRQPATNEME